MNNFDDVVRDIREEKVNDAVVMAAGRRVHDRLFGEAAVGGAHIRGCVDFRTLIPEYLRGGLTPARRMLLEDHTHECVDCRRALAEAKAPAKLIRIDRRPTIWSRPEMRWAMAAMLVIGVGVGSVTLIPNLIPVSGPRATVSTVEGALYNVANAVIAPISTGATVEEGQPVRTAKATYAVLKLADGSKVEMNERAQIAILRTWRGTTIRLDAGNIIVQAAKQKHGKLYVASGDATVAVKGTVFAVSRGLKGSRVSVIEGVVEVAHSGQTETLRKGDQTTTDANLLKTSVPEEVSWSRNSAQYYALLGEFATLQKKLEAIPGPGLRYSSKLASYLPENTAVYLAIPNIASTLAEAERLIEEQSRDSAVLREWWEKRDKNGFQKALAELKTVGQYVGDEIVIGLAANDQSQPRDPMVLAEVKRPGLKAYIETKMAEMGAGQGRPKVAANMSELAATHRSEKEPVMYASDSLFVMSPDPAAVSRAVAGQGGFTKTELWNRVSKSYQSGAGWLLAVDMEQMMKNGVSGKEGLDKSGFGDARYLIAERKETGGKTETRASVSFAGERHGVASWLGAPGQMGSLEFVSPEATTVTSFVIKNPRQIVEELLAMGQSNGDAAAKIAEFESKTGISITNDIAGSLGSEITVAIDGPVLPIPSWKLVAEVYNPDRLQFSIGKMVEALNAVSAAGVGTTTMTTEQVSGRTYYTLKNDKSPIEAHYTYVDTYLLAGSSTALLEQAINNRQTGYTLTRSQTFRSLLPRDGYTSFSGVMFFNAASTLGPILDQLKQAATPEQRKSIEAYTANSTPTLIYAYGEPDRITLASTGSFFGMNIGTLLGAHGDRGMLFPQLLGPAFERGKMHATHTQ